MNCTCDWGVRELWSMKNEQFIWIIIHIIIVEVYQDFFHDGHHHRNWLCQIVSGATCTVTQVSLYSLLWLHLGSLESILGVVGSWMLIHPENGTGMYEWLGQVRYCPPLLFHCRRTLIFRLKWASWMLFYVGSLSTLVRKGIGNEE